MPGQITSPVLTNKNKLQRHRMMKKFYNKNKLAEQYRKGVLINNNTIKDMLGYKTDRVWFSRLL